MSVASRLLGVSILVAALGCARDAVAPTSDARVDGRPNTAGSPHNSEQVVFSGVAGAGSTFQNGSPVGFWVWCEAESENPYDEECNGSMYFYALGITRHVEGEIVETAEGIYQATVSSTRDGAILDCVIENLAEAVNGPSNSVRVTCTTPSGTATTTTAVVNVTGP